MAQHAMFSILYADILQEHFPEILAIQARYLPLVARSLRKRDQQVHYSRFLILVYYYELYFYVLSNDLKVCYYTRQQSHKLLKNFFY